MEKPRKPGAPIFFLLSGLFFLQGGASYLRKWDWGHLPKERCLNLMGVYVVAQILYFLVW